MTAAAGTRWADGIRSDRLDDAVAQLGAQRTRGAERLARLPAGADRSPADHATADGIQAEARALRTAIMRAFADDIYDELTNARRTRLSLANLAFAAATVFPGLVPDRATIDAERRLDQAAKEGAEIDQGIFFWGLLRSTRAGRHLVESATEPTPRALAMLDDFRSRGEAMLDTVTLRRVDGIGRLTVHNTAYLNAEDDQIAEDMETAVDLVLLDDDVRVGVVRGAVMSHPRYPGRVFNAGINLTHLYHGQISFVDFLLRRELGYIAKIMRGLRRDDSAPLREKPWLAAVDTFAIGGGMQLLLAFDRVVAEQDAYFTLPAAREGIVPGAANLRLSRSVGPRLARQLIIGGRRLAASEPEGRLICDAVVPPGAMDAEIDTGAAQLAEPGVVANRHMMHLAEEPIDVFRSYLGEFARVQAARLYSADVLQRLDETWVRRQR